MQQHTSQFLLFGRRKVNLSNMKSTQRHFKLPDAKRHTTSRLSSARPHRDGSKSHQQAYLEAGQLVILTCRRRWAKKKNEGTVNQARRCINDIPVFCVVVPRCRHSWVTHRRQPVGTRTGSSEVSLIQGKTSYAFFNLWIELDAARLALLRVRCCRCWWRCTGIWPPTHTLSFRI